MSKVQKAPSPSSVVVKTEKGVDIPQTNNDMDWEQTKTYLDTTMEIFHSLEDMSDLKGMYEMGKSLSRTYFNCANFRKEMAELLVSHEFPAYASKMMKRLNNLGVFKNDDIWFSSFYFYNISWNFSDASHAFATALGVAGLPNLLNLNIGHQPYLDNLTSKNVYYLIKASLSIMHNIARVAGNSHFFSDDTVKTSLIFLAQREEEFLKCVATLTLAYVITENETQILDKSAEAIEKIIEFVEKANKAPKRRYHGFTVEEILCALAALVVNDNIKKVVVEHQGVPLLKQLCESANAKEVEHSVKCLWNLAFDCEICKQLKNEFQIIPFLEKLKSHESDDVVKAAEGALWLITQEKQAVEEAQKRVASAKRGEPVDGPKSGLKNYVFLSYCHDNKENVMKVYQRLKTFGIPVWIDAEHMKGHTLDAMADGIEFCSLVLVCMSDSYKQSAACRTEAEYSYQLKKPIIPLVLQYKYKPNGWLGLIVGSKKYFDFSGRRDFDNVFEQLHHEIEEIRNPVIIPPDSTTSAVPDSNHHLVNSVDDFIKPTNNVDHHAKTNSDAVDGFKTNSSYQPDDHFVTKPHVNAVNLPDSVLSWTCADVRLWLQEAGLSTRCAAMSEINGRLLGQLFELKREAPEFFYRCLQDRLGFTLVDLLRLNEALVKMASK